MKKKKGMSVVAKQHAAGWIYLAPATILIAVMSFYPIIQAIITSLKTGSSANMKWAEPIFYNYTRMFQDKLFLRSVGNTFLYLLIEVPIMLILAILLAQLLNNKDLKFKGFFRTCVFLPCATSLVSYSLIFKSLFATQGLMNSILMNLGIIHENINFLGNSGSAKAIIIIALIWRWTGYNMVFYLAGLQNIDYSVYEASYLDGASPFKQFTKITIPLLKPVIATVMIFNFQGTWSEFYWALIEIKKDSLKTLPLGLMNFNSMYNTDYGVLCAGLCIATIPVVLLYLKCSSYFIGGMVAGAVKG